MLPLILDRTGPYQKLEYVIDKYSEALDKYLTH